MAEPLRRALSDGTTEIRVEAIRALESMRDKRAIPDIEKLIADRDYWCRIRPAGPSRCSTGRNRE